MTTPRDALVASFPSGPMLARTPFNAAVLSFLMKLSIAARLSMVVAVPNEAASRPTAANVLSMMVGESMGMEKLGLRCSRGNYCAIQAVEQEDEVEYLCT